MLEKSVIEHCSPTLASIKTGNLFTYKYESEEELWESVEGFNECVREKGVSLTVLRRSEKKALIYVCRLSSLERDLKKPGVANFIKKYGYESTDPAYALERQDFLCLICPLDTCHYITGCTCYYLLLYR